jgi:hypothetical protein
MTSLEPQKLPPDLQDGALKPEERTYRDRFFRLFELVMPRYPEKGVRAMLARANAQVQQYGISLTEALEDQYRQAEIRTQRRVALLAACKLPSEKASQGEDSTD